MNIQLFKNHFYAELQNLYPESEIQSFFYILIAFKLKLNKVDLALKPDLNFTDNELLFFQNSVSKLKKQIPIQYITGETEFFGLSFRVNEHVLIPRPETEELVQWILEAYPSNTPLKILDIGTGSGCIAISLAKNLRKAQVIALDISSAALEIAEQNAFQNKVDVRFIEKDILTEENLLDTFDIIVSNPPYVRMSEKKHMAANVIENEPKIALFVKDDNPLVFYEKITSLAKKHLKTNGTLYFEINQYLGSRMKALLKLNDFKNIELKKDIFQVDRMMKASRT